MEIVETRVFTRQVQGLLTEEEYRELQHVLIARPEVGVLIPGAGGLRKLRWKAGGRGKSGGIRTIYYWATQRETILLLFAYSKRAKEDLTAEQIKVLRKLVETEFP